ncbi:hypothetical protein JCM19239_4743 [Vibrio variabilis]|uniref:Aerotolerance regulator BatA n=1 Tax=Vibrio variabilis TaxID=990271 RepID=A0ABQ0JQJ3_9VIBR|nr:hypothetical protein JCM19239_4743 [Vibrio variabilis]
MFDFEFLYPQALWLLLPMVAISLWLKSSQKSSSIIADHLAKHLAPIQRRTASFGGSLPYALP